jgi:hypothetical protein
VRCDSCGALEAQVPLHVGPFYVHEIAYALARRPGRIECDYDEARCIGADMFDWYGRGKFGEQEVVAQYGDPLRWGPITQRQEEARQRGEAWEDLHLGLWYAVIALTYPAARRYVEGCGLEGAQRVFEEWFTPTNASIPAAAPSETPLLSNVRRGTPGPKPKVRKAIADKMFDDLRSNKRTLGELRGDTLAALAAHYGGSPNTANMARKDALERFSQFQN